VTSPFFMLARDAATTNNDLSSIESVSCLFLARRPWLGLRGVGSAFEFRVGPRGAGLISVLLFFFSLWLLSAGHRLIDS
jgi:hypothetical protein